MQRLCRRIVRFGQQGTVELAGCRHSRCALRWFAALVQLKALSSVAVDLMAFGKEAVAYGFCWVSQVGLTCCGCFLCGPSCQQHRDLKLVGLRLLLGLPSQTLAGEPRSSGFAPSALGVVGVACCKPILGCSRHVVRRLHYDSDSDAPCSRECGRA